MSDRALSKQFTIADADGSNLQIFDILIDDNGQLQWFEGSESEEKARPGEPVSRRFAFFGGGAGETVDTGKGGYYYSNNCYVGNPFAIRPRPEATTVTLTDNTTPVLRFFEAKSASGIKYLYALTKTKVFKVRMDNHTLVNTRDFSAPNIKFATGSYTADGTATNFEVGFAPKAVIIKAIDGAYATVIKTDEMALSSYKNIDGPYTAGGPIDFLMFSGTKFGFTGTHTGFNHDGTTYCWMAFGGKDAYVKTGKFSGDGTDNRDITIATSWGQPDALFIFTDNDADHVVFKPKDAAADLSWDLNGGAAETNLVEEPATWPVDGFEVGSDNRVNRSGTNNVFYLALKEDTDVLKVASYAGNGVDNRNITDPGFDPTYALICTEYSVPLVPVHRSNKCSGDSTMYFCATANGTNSIQDLITNGFQLGSSDYVNRNGETYYYLAIRPDPVGEIVHGQPAEWNNIWEKPNGDDVDWDGLTTIADGTDDDTWTARTGLKATHFCSFKNVLARAYSDRTISLCSATDISVSGNWSGAEEIYNVGPVGTKITNLNEWRDELLVCTEDGLYQFDGIATSIQQLPLLGGVKDEDNGKGTLNWMSQVFVGTADGWLRWRYGAAKPIGLDSIFGYVNAEGTSSEPVHLQHYGSTFLEDWIYNACKDPSGNYHIIYARPAGEGFRQDFLLTSTSEITMPYIDSDRQLWFNLGNDIAYIQLERGGEPSGGNFGEASLTGSYYFPEFMPAEGAETRLRMLKVITRNNQTTLTWKMYVYRDGASAEQVGAAAGFKTDGVTKLYWNPASDLKARRLRLRLDFACSSFTPETTPPESIEVEFFGDALPDKANAIRAVVGLKSEDRSAKHNYDRLAACENTGVKRIRNPITDDVVNVVIYHREMVWVRQTGYEEPTVGVMLYMRRGDTE